MGKMCGVRHRTQRLIDKGHMEVIDWESFVETVKELDAAFELI
jgi:hypothetical protein